jgi:hypothetical protein
MSIRLIHERAQGESKTAIPIIVPDRTVPELPSPTWQRESQSILVILICGIAVRVLYHLIFVPWWSADTITYVDASCLLRHGYFTDGARTPGYPIFLSLARWLSLATTPCFDGSSMAVAAVLQSGLGLITTALIYDTLRILRVRKSLALIGTLFFAVLHGPCEFEMALLSQSLSLFALVVGIWLFTRAMAKVGQRENPVALTILTGVALSFAVLVRPENLVFSGALILVVALLWLRSKFFQTSDKRPRSWGVLALALPLALAPILFAWMTWNYIGIGRFTITTLTSWNMSSSVYNLFDRVEPEDQVLGELLVKANLVRNYPEMVTGEKFWKPTQPGQVVQDTYWTTIWEIVNRRREMPIPPPHPTSSTFFLWIRGLGSAEARRFTHAFAAGARIQVASTDNPDNIGDPNTIGEYVNSVSWKLVKKYPALWFLNIVDNFNREAFTFSLFPPPPSELKDPRSWEGGTVVREQKLWSFAVWWNRIQAPFLTVFFILTLGIALFAPAIVLRANDASIACDATVVALSTGVVGTFITCCMFACYMPHYGLPHWGAIVICGVYAMDRALGVLQSRRMARVIVND